MDSERLGALPCCRRLCRQKVTVSRGSLTPFVRISPMGHGGTPRNVCAFSETSIRSATATSDNFSLSPCSGSPRLYKDFFARSVTRCPGFAALGIDCDRLTSGVVILSQTMLVVPFCTIFRLSQAIGDLYSSLIMRLYVFTVPDSMLLIIVQSTNDFNLLAL